MYVLALDQASECMPRRTPRTKARMEKTSSTKAARATTGMTNSAQWNPMLETRTFWLTSGVSPLDMFKLDKQP